MRRKLLLSSLVLFVLLSSGFVVFVEAEASMWSQTYGGTGTEEAHSLVLTSDGGYALVGGGLFVKTDANGNMEWSKTYGGLDWGYAESLVATSDGGYAIAGWKESSGGQPDMWGNVPYDFWLIKTDALGNMEWSQTYGGSGQNYAYCVVETSDGGFALAGVKDYEPSRYGGMGQPSIPAKGNFWLVKTDPYGSMKWNRIYGGAGHDRAYSLLATNDGGYAIAGYTHSFGAGGSDFWLVKTDASGSLKWNRTYGGEEDEEAYSLVESSGGGYAIAGNERNHFGLVKTDASGNMEWNKTYGGGAARSVFATSDGGYAVAGYKWSDFTGSGNVWLGKTDSVGNLQWSQWYGGKKDDYGRSVVETADGGYVIAGYTNSFGAGSSDFWLIKTDEYGSSQMPEPLPEPSNEQTYGGKGDEYAYSMVATSDGGYALAGSTTSFGAGGDDFWLVKTDANGTMEWNQTYGGTEDECAYSVVETSDGGYAIAGTTNIGDWAFACWLVKTDSSGNMEWNRTYGGGWIEDACSVVETSDGGYAIEGGKMGDFWLVKTDEFGNTEWNRTYGGEGREVAQSLVATGDGGYALAGYTNPPGMDRGIEFLLVKTDEAGNVEWNQTYDGIGSIYGGSLVATSDGGYALVADTTRFGAQDYDVWLAKTDSSGNLQWSQTYGGTKHDYGYSVIETSDGGYAMAGFTYSFGAGQEDFWLVKTDASGNLEWNQTYGGLSAEHAYSVVEAADGGYAIAGSRYSIDGDHDFLWIKTDEYGNSQMPESGQEPDHEDSNKSPTNIPEIIAVIGVASAIILLIYLIIRKQKIKT